MVSHCYVLVLERFYYTPTLVSHDS